MVNLQTYVGTASPYNFNGLVRHYYLRRGLERRRYPGEPAAARATASCRATRSPSRCAQRLLPVAERFGARIKVAEVPPGPPVLETLVAEVYGPAHDEPHRHRAADSRPVEAHRRRGGRGLVRGRRPAEVPPAGGQGEGRAQRHLRRRYRARPCRLASAGYPAGLLHVGFRQGRRAARWCAWTAPARSDLDRMQNLKVAGRTGRLVALGELVHGRGSASTTRASTTRT